MFRILLLTIALTVAAKAAFAGFEESLADHLLDIQVAAQSNRGGIEMYTPPTSKAGLSETECLAVAIYHEARGEGLVGQIAVASVILRRVAVPGRWSDTICQTVVPVQFSFLIDKETFAPIDDFEAWNEALAVADHMIAAGPLDEFLDADHYHTVSSRPGWRLRMPRVFRIGSHIFYADPLSAS